MDRYRVLMPGLTMADVTDFKMTSRRICKRVLGDHDWQIGRTKVFIKVHPLPSFPLFPLSFPLHPIHLSFIPSLCLSLLFPLPPSLPPSLPPPQDADDQLLEEERDRVLTEYVILIQKWVRGWFLRRRFLAMRKAAVVLQKNYRRHLHSRRYRIVRH